MLQRTRKQPQRGDVVEVRGLERSARVDVAIVGAGPYGLAAGAHLRAIRGLDAAVFGEPMRFWKSRMPKGMLLRSPQAQSSISHPDGAMTLARFDAERREARPGHAPIELERFIRYGLWFQGKALPGVDQRVIERVEPSGDGYLVTPLDAAPFFSKRVVVATGLGAFAHRPQPYASLPPELVSHCSDHRDLSRFKGKTIVVVGAGQAALEHAALVAECGGDVEVLARADAIHWHGRGGAARKAARLSLISRVAGSPGGLRLLPRPVQDRLLRLCLKPSAAWGLVERLKDVRITTGRFAVAAREASGAAHLTLDDGSQRRIDHVVLGTGYKVDIARYDFLAPALAARVRQAGGFPVLSRGMESSAPGLHFVGAPATWSFGPLMNSIAGTDFAAKELARALRRRR